MKITIVSKTQLNTTDADNKKFSKTADAYTSACNEISEYAFENYLMTEKVALHNAKYRDIRINHGLKSQMACSVFRTVTAKYKTVKEQMKQNPFTMMEDGKTYRTKKTLDWLWKPIKFQKPIAELVRGRDYSLCGDKLSINTLDGRVKVSYQSYNMNYLLEQGWKMGTATLLCKKGMWYLHISFTKEFDNIEEFKSVVGNDRGLRFLSTTFDGSKTVFYDGKDVVEKREKYARTRASLQSKGTKGAKRVLKRIAGRENRWMSDVNHCLSKTLILKCECGTLIVIEDLSKVSTDEKNLRSKKQRRRLRSWAFYDLEQKLIYKAHLRGCEVVKVPPQRTSQRCPKCGYIHKSNRNRKTHEFLCKKCDYRSNDDRVAAMNIRELGERYLKTGELKGFPKQ